MPNVGLRICDQIMQMFADNGFNKGDKVYRPNIRYFIRRCAGLDDRTIVKYFHHLIDLGYIREIDQGVFIIKLVPSSAKQNNLKDVSIKKQKPSYKLTKEEKAMLKSR